MKKVLVVATILVFALSALAFAAGHNPNCKLGIHVLAHATRSCTKNFPTVNACTDIITTYPEYNVDFFPVFYNITEATAVEFGVMWVGSSCTWTSCATLGFGDITHPGGGRTEGWSTCQQKYAVICGYGWIYSYGFIEPVPHPLAGGPSIADCQDPAQVDHPICLIKAGTNGLQGDDPCAETATEQSTWGSIKAMFR